ncbi:alpha- and gamma-adaptin-binding protein p34 [Condylostylus longicornis]|uniref:alpha- and gamma-adaptin-binding protein p34 n=1 Tax=Condylostylus longicornis TaxID=2530218 RepID=UPI00244DA882|nr:alpha- and gamma-adaptin-binding protein p34 [Condylostylus longicornis]
MEATHKPIVLVISETTKTTPISIINKIRKSDENENVSEVENKSGSPLKGYSHGIKNKYYETQILLMPFDDDLVLLPSDILPQIEGILIYFDPKVRTFSTKIQTYADFLESNGIELGILLCDLLYDNIAEGLTYKEVREKCTALDVIELARTNEENEDNHLNPCGYDELHQVLRNVIWSNVSMTGASATSSIAASRVNSGPLNPTNPTDRTMENELEMFEKLLSEVLMFKDTTSGLSRNERLLYAEQIAGKFDKLLEDDSSDAEK